MFGVFQLEASPDHVSRALPQLAEGGSRRLASDEPALVLANAFLDRLDAMPIPEWVDVGRRVMATRKAVPLRASARANIDGSIARHGLGVAAWSVCDAVETIAFLKREGVSGPSYWARRVFAAAHGAAEDAVLATLVRQHLSANEFAVLCTLFDDSGRTRHLRSVID